MSGTPETQVIRKDVKEMELVKQGDTRYLRIRLSSGEQQLIQITQDFWSSYTDTVITNFVVGAVLSSIIWAVVMSVL